MSLSDRTTVSDTNRDAYKHFISVTLRYGDTDRQGHVNNAVFCTLLESGRVDMLFEGAEALCGEGCSFVIAKLTLDFLSEINFPGSVEVASRVLHIGRSSFTVGQALFKDGVCCASAQSVVVQIDDSTKRSTSLSPRIMDRLTHLS